MTGLATLLIGRGVRSDLAERVAQRFPDWQSFSSADPLELAQSFSEPDLRQLREAKTRRQIPVETMRRLVDDSDLKCCVCWNVDSDTGVVIHHIDSHTATLDDSYENLIVLCPNHHSKVHTKWELARHPLPPELLKRLKTEFCLALRGFKAGRRSAPGRENDAVLGVMTSPPLPPPYFTGRDNLVDEVAQALAQGKRAAIVGMGGCGKTAAALKIADLSRDRFAGGVLWAEIAPDTAGVAGTLRTWIRALGADVGDLRLDEQFPLFSHFLAQRVISVGPILLLIDGIGERGVDELVRLNSYLPTGVEVLITTRESSVGAAIGALDFPLESLERTSSQRLLGALTGSAVIDLESEDVNVLLSLIGDLPLAVELIARQIAVFHEKPGFSIGEICERLRQFDPKLLAFPGHRGIAVTFALSYENLNDGEQALFRCFGAFASGPLDISHVATVATLDEEEAENRLDRLVAVSMLNWAETRGTYRLHALLHKYAELLLVKISPRERRHVIGRFYRHFTKVAIDTAKDMPKALNLIDRIYTNLTKAIYDAAAENEHARVSETVLGLSAAMGFFLSRNLESESIPLLELSVSHASQAGDKDSEAALIAAAGTSYNRLGHLDIAIERYRAAIEIVRQTGNDFDLSSNLQNLGTALLNRTTELPEAERCLREGLAAAERSRNPDAALGCLGSLGSLHRQIGNLNEAERLYTGALKMARLIGEPLSVGNSLSNLGLVRHQLGFADGESLIREALQIAMEIGDKRGQGNRLGHLGGMLVDNARRLPVGAERSRVIDDARTHIAAAVDLARETRDAHKTAVWTMNLANVHALNGDDDSALDLYQEALRLATDRGFTEVEAQANCNLGSLHAKRGQIDIALLFFGVARQLLKGTRSPILVQVEDSIHRLHAARSWSSTHQ